MATLERWSQPQRTALLPLWHSCDKGPHKAPGSV